LGGWVNIELTVSRLEYHRIPMTFEILVNKHLNLVYTKYLGFVETNQMEQAMFKTLEHPDFSPGMLELTDLSEVEDTDLNLVSLNGHTSQMAAYYEMQAKQTTHYIFAPSDLGFQLAQEYRRMANSEIKNLELCVFRSETEVLKAIGVPANSIAELLSS
jgi:hypothetical protein